MYARKLKVSLSNEVGLGKLRCVHLKCSPVCFGARRLANVPPVSLARSMPASRVFTRGQRLGHSAPGIIRASGELGNVNSWAGLDGGDRQ